MNNDTISSRQIAGWLVDAERVLRTADESSEEYAAARAISTLCMALLGTGCELQDLRARNQEVESLLVVQQRAIDTQQSGEPSAAWYPAETSPDVPRGEFLDCWVAGYVCERDHAAGPEQYTSAQLLVLLARWGGVELLHGDEGGWSFDERLPDEGFKPLAWQPIVKPEFPLGVL